MTDRVSRGGMKVTVFLLAFSFFAYSFTTLPVQYLVTDTSSTFANAVVGVFAGVEENRFNTLAQELQQKEEELNAREAALAARESSDTFAGSFSNDFVLLSFGMSALVLLLLILNFYFDWRRGRAPQSRERDFAINLKK